MKFISYEIRQACIDPLGVDVVPVSEMQPEKVPKPTFWSLYGRAPADSDGRCLIENVWDAPSYIEIRRTYQRLTGCDLPEQEQDYFGLPVDPPAKRTEPDYLTAGFMAIGADTEFRRQAAEGAYFVLQDGYLGFIGDVLQHGLLLDKVADHIDKHGEHPGCWCYDVAEAFGGKFAEQVLLGCDSAESAKILLREIMVEAGYDQTLLDAAFSAALGIPPEVEEVAYASPSL
jgi:hypothetical protein